jgi:hypothetical protein
MGPHDLLIAYFREQRGRRFKLGEHDCFTFTNGAWRLMHGEGYADDLTGAYGSLSASEMADFILGHYGAESVTEALDAHLTRCDGHPPRGALVVTDQARECIIPFALGIAFGTRAVFLGARDVVYLPVTQIKGAWVSCQR